MTQNNSKTVDFFIDFIKDEINKPEFKSSIIKPMILYFLYYIIPLLAVLIVLNFITTIIAVFLVFYIKNNILG
jgi:hypothetical protein